MKALSLRAAIAALVLSTIVFTLSLAAFCYALGLDLQNEGWSDPAGVSAMDRGWLVGSMVGFGISIVLFFVGLHRISKPGGDR